MTPVIDYYRIELEPASSPLLDGKDGTPLAVPSARAEVFGEAYADRLTRYEGDLDRDALRRRWGTGIGRRYPEHKVVLPGQTITIVYDGDLDRRLLEVYVWHGWRGIDTVREALRQVERGPLRALFPWRIAGEFLSFARNLLIAAVRAELMAFEREAAELLILRLNNSRNMAAEAWSALDVRRSTKEERKVTLSRIMADQPTRIPDLSYVLGNDKLATQLLDVVTPLVRIREELTKLKAKRDRKQEMLDAARAELGSSFDTGTELDIAELTAQIGELVEQTEHLYRDLHALCPIAVLAVPVLRFPVPMYALTGALVQAVMGFVGHAEVIARALSAEGSWVGEVLEAPRPGEELEQSYPADMQPERAVADVALERGSGDSRYLSMLHVATLTELTGRADGLGYVVRSQYVAVLLERLQDEEEFRRALAAIFGVLAKVAAVISLVALVTPLGWFTRAIAVALDVGAIAYQVHAAVGQLAQFDRDVAEAMVELDREDVEKLARLSELTQLRPEFVEQLTVSVITEIGLIVTAGAWADFRRLMHIRGYYSDLETLVER
ncbi:MAG: hypothetical protein M3313_02180 [Actinomycetota bacterium]|nr:hypothetical protein [Actinomycetota bacterium]